MKKLLVANRGEIAVRVIRAAREMGVRTVAVYSEADKNSIHTAIGDEAIEIGASEPAASYLNIRALLEAARACGADAIHPGYGFLSERAEFAKACEDAGIKFVGPCSNAMSLLGSKIAAKGLAKQSGVPVTPGYFEAGATPAQLKDAASRIGYPVMLKASAGGGGRGMRVVRDQSDFESELKIASDEALKAFGDGAMMVEKLIERPRHIEVQVLADEHGRIACLFERECSLQRRHQKIIEEAPSPIGGHVWPEMREAVERLVKAAKYTNAGTVEFMFDEAAGEFYFLEVNTRLQVEHPVTEAIAGVDLVQWQLRVADGEKLSMPSLERERIQGHALEARIVAEDPAHGFRPSIGRIVAWAEPKLPGVRVDTGYGPGSEISRHYDSLIAKVISHAATRTEAIRRLEAALLDFHVLGVRTNIAYLVDVLRHPDFVAGRIDTGFLERELDGWQDSKELPVGLAEIIADARKPAVGAESNYARAWDLGDSFRVS